MNILFIADVVGVPGRRAVEERLAALRVELDVGFCIVNGENVADGVGLTPKLAENLVAAGVDGGATAVFGTHTHVQTNDARVQPGGTAALTDAGMTGPHDSVIGVVAEHAIYRMRTGLPIRFETASGDVRIEGALVTCGPDGRATRCETVRVQIA